MNLKRDKLTLYSLILGFLGFLDATYLTILHYKNVIPPCTVTSGCEVVLTSKYSVVAGIPVSFLGTLFYVTVMAICILILTNYKEVFVKAYYGLVGIGFAVSLVLIYIQGAFLHAFCQYCLLSEIVSFGLVLMAIIKFRQDKNLSAPQEDKRG